MNTVQDMTIFIVNICPMKSDGWVRVLIWKSTSDTRRDYKMQLATASPRTIKIKSIFITFRLQLSVQPWEYFNDCFVIIIMMIIFYLNSGRWICNKLRRKKQKIIRSLDDAWLLFMKAGMLFLLTLLTKHFGRFKFQTKRCPKIKPSEIFKRPKY